MTNNFATIPMIINKCNGEFEYSQKALDEYNKRAGTNIQMVNLVFAEQYISRFDPIMIDIIRKNDHFASTDASNLVIIDVIKEYVPYINIVTNDGIEYIHYNLNQYNLDKIKKIIISNMEPDGKIFHIATIINQPEYK